MALDKELRRELRDYAWKYFDRHAEQRLKTFNFYVLFCGGIFAGLLTVLRDHETQWLGIPLGILSALVSFVFWKLDRRTRFLKDHSEEALKFLENDLELPDEGPNVPHRMKLFVREKHEQSKCGPEEYSYSTCFNWLFVLFGWGGVALVIWLAWKTNNP